MLSDDTIIFSSDYATCDADTAVVLLGLLLATMFLGPAIPADDALYADAVKAGVVFA